MSDASARQFSLISSERYLALDLISSEKSAAILIKADDEGVVIDAVCDEGEVAESTWGTYAEVSDEYRIAFPKRSDTVQHEMLEQGVTTIFIQNLKAVVTVDGDDIGVVLKAKDDSVELGILEVSRRALVTEDAAPRP